MMLPPGLSPLRSRSRSRSGSRVLGKVLAALAIVVAVLVLIGFGVDQQAKHHVVTTQSVHTAQSGG